VRVKKIITLIGATSKYPTRVLAHYRLRIERWITPTTSAVGLGTILRTRFLFLYKLGTYLLNFTLMMLFTVCVL